MKTIYEMYKGIGDHCGKPIPGGPERCEELWGNVWRKNSFSSSEQQFLSRVKIISKAVDSRVSDDRDAASVLAEMQDKYDERDGKGGLSGFIEHLRAIGYVQGGKTRKRKRNNGEDGGGEDAGARSRRDTVPEADNIATTSGGNSG